ncbi:MAG: S9 family peptidase [Paludibacteraceae bacterium]|nr:S9 family peptidase [Paludibacteraceae bacterium]
MAAIVMGCSNSPDSIVKSQEPTANSQDKAPIGKPELRIKGGRMTPEALWSMGRIGSVKTDIETGWLAYTVSYYSIEENRSTSWIRICDPFEGPTPTLPEGKEEKPNPDPSLKGREESMQVLDEFVGSEPAWFGNSGWLAFMRGGQLYLRRDKEEVKVEGANDIEGFLLSPKRDKIIVIKSVKTIPSTVDKYPDLPLATGHMHEDLMYKHWDEWTETAPQPFVYELKIDYFGEGERIVSATLGKGFNLLEGTAFECPMKPFGGVEQLAWNPNNEEIAYTCRKKTGLDYAVSTNSDIYLYNLKTRKTRNITEANKGYDINPAYSRDGQWIAWLSMERDGYESDENRLAVMNLKSGEQRYLVAGWGDHVDEFAWYDDTTLLYTCCAEGTVDMYMTSVHGGGERMTEGQYDVSIGDVGWHEVYLLCHSMRQANEIYRFDVAQYLSDPSREYGPRGIDWQTPHSALEVELAQLTHENDNIYRQIELSTVVPRWQKTSDGKDMLTWIIYPPHFNPKKKYATILYCEGGPQSPVSQFWSYRWNFMMMSAGDYIIVAPNRRGLPGFGKEWNEEISGDYGGQCMTDLLTAIDEFCTEPYVDKDRLGCVGASFGGYSVYWLAGHHEGRFKAFIAHDGIFNLEMQYLETEEKWFANWDLGGAYWEKENAVAQRTYANSPHRFVDRWDTPILCIHGEKDYRILANQAMAAFDAAKMRGVPAELLIFPDENHWVLKPQNGILWQREFRGWLDRWLKE